MGESDSTDRRRVILVERGTNRRVGVEVSPLMTPDEVVDAIRVAASVREPIDLWRRDHRGREVRVTGVSGRELLEAADSGVVLMFEPRRVYG